MNLENIKDVSLEQIAFIIYRDWKPVNYAAKPYLEAMSSLENIGQTYGADSGKTVVSYFLSNASTWRGETARTVKAELRRRIA